MFVIVEFLFLEGHTGGQKADAARALRWCSCPGLCEVGQDTCNSMLSGFLADTWWLTCDYHTCWAPSCHYAFTSGPRTHTLPILVPTCHHSRVLGLGASFSPPARLWLLRVCRALSWDRPLSVLRAAMCERLLAVQEGAGSRAQVPGSPQPGCRLWLWSSFSNCSWLCSSFKLSQVTTDLFHICYFWCQVYCCACERHSDPDPVLPRETTNHSGAAGVPVWPRWYCLLLPARPDFFCLGPSSSSTCQCPPFYRWTNRFRAARCLPQDSLLPR